MPNRKQNSGGGQNKQGQNPSASSTSGQGQDFSQQVDSNLRGRIKGEHSLQNDHDGKSFKQAQQQNADPTEDFDEARQHEPGQGQQSRGQQGGSQGGRQGGASRPGGADDAGGGSKRSGDRGKKG